MSPPRVWTVALAAMAGIVGSMASVSRAEAAYITQHAVNVASAAWPDSACAGRLDVREADLSSRGDARLGEAVIGDTKRCRITLDGRSFRALDQSYGCAIIVHEAGHLAGRGHSPSGIMAAIVEPWPPCDKPAPRALTVRQQIRLAAARRAHVAPSRVQLGKWRRLEVVARIRLDQGRTVRYRARVSADGGFRLTRIR